MNKQNIFTEQELQGILSMGIYWEEVNRREGNVNEIFAQELNQLYRFLGARRILFSVLNIAKQEKKNIEEGEISADKA